MQSSSWIPRRALNAVLPWKATDILGLGAEVELVTDQGFRGDKLKAFYCKNEKCGYVELHRAKRVW